MDVIIVMLDSFRQDHVGTYHRGERAFDDVPPCRTPCIDRFAADSLVFTNCYPEGLPTIPVRTALMTGNYTLPFRPWQPLAKEDYPMARILRENGYVCALISDTYHYRAPGMNFHQHFHSYDWVRGQEWDTWASQPTRRDVSDFVNENYPEQFRNLIAQYLANTDNTAGNEERMFPAQVMDRSIAWLEANRGRRPVMLWIDCFDPHEPWDPPKRFDTYCDPAYSGPRLIMPMGGPARTWASPEEERHIRGLYAGEASFVDDCFGRLLDALDRLGYLDTALVILTADHGHPLGDHGKFLKGADRMYSELLHVPFIVRLPGGAGGGRRTDALVQFQDVLPTILELVGLASNTDCMHGRSFAPILRGDSDELRRSIVVGYHEGGDRCFRDHRLSFIERPGDEPDELYDLRDDPRETRNLIDEQPEEAARLTAAFGSMFRRRSGPYVKGVQGRYEVATASM